MDWYSALLIGGEEYVNELVQTIEIAKIQLLELKTYDKLLDTRIDKAYGSLRGVFSIRGLELLGSAKPITSFREPQANWLSLGLRLSIMCMI